MINSIQYFEETCIHQLEELENNFLRNPQNMAEYVYGITKELHKLGLEMIKESLETMDGMIQESPIRKVHWIVESHTQKQLLTSLGDVVFHKTLFTNKKTGKSEYLLDRILGIGPKERMTEDAEAGLLGEAVQTCYERAGGVASLTSKVSRQTVKNKIHSLKFPKNEKKPEEKKQVEYLYIDADEDHVALQFRKKKGDLVTNAHGQKNNGLITKLVYVYEGIERESPKGERHHLIHPHYFCGVNAGKGNEAFWDEIFEYMDYHYDLGKVKKIYLNSDAGSWIKSGVRRIKGIQPVLDEFHLKKYLTKVTRHQKEGKKEFLEELEKTIRSKTKTEFEEQVRKGLEGDNVLTETEKNRIEKAKGYLLSNWTAAKTRLRKKDGVKGSSTEGHVSHILSSRMSSRPMGWSKQGAAGMAQLRAYYFNGGNMLELVRYQKKEQPKMEQEEYDILSSTQILVSEKNRHGELGKYMDCITHSLSLQNKKKVYFNAHIWGL